MRMAERRGMNEIMLIIALTLFGEARGETHQGKVAVASVIYNRAKERGVTMTAVCLQPKQFSCWGDEMLINKVHGSLDAWFDCVIIAQAMTDGSFQPVLNANHYYNPDLASPSWGDLLEEVAVIGRHRFGRLS